MISPMAYLGLLSRLNGGIACGDTYTNLTIWRCGFLICIMSLLLPPAVQAMEPKDLEGRDADSIVYITTDYLDPKVTTQPRVGPVGTGVIIDPDGTIITALHVIRDWMGQSKEGKLLYQLKARIGTAHSDNIYPLVPLNTGDVSKDDDIVILKILKPGSYHAVPICFTGSPAKDAPMVAIGIPGTGNIYSDAGMYKNSINGSGFWVTNLRISPGMSGGPIYDRAGNVIGLAQGAVDESGAPSFVIPLASSDTLIASHPSQHCDKPPPVPPVPTPQPPNIEVRYMQKAADRGSVEAALKDIGITPIIFPGQNSLPTNVISCSPGAPIDTVKMMAKAMMLRGVPIRGIAPQLPQQRKFIQVENYESYARMPLMTEEELSSIESCPTYDADFYPSPTIWIYYNCPYGYNGPITYYDAHRQPLIINALMYPGTKFSAMSSNGYLYPSGATFFLVNGIKVQIGSTVDCNFSAMN
jgi:hypothetical protein